jgi:hypothetical protein
VPPIGREHILAQLLALLTDINAQKVSHRRPRVTQGQRFELKVAKSG